MRRPAPRLPPPLPLVDSGRKEERNRMGHRKSTLRKKPPMTRKYLKILAEIESAVRRLENLEYDIQDAEMCRAAMERKKRAGK